MLIRRRLDWGRSWVVTFALVVGIILCLLFWLKPDGGCYPGSRFLHGPHVFFACGERALEEERYGDAKHWYELSAKYGHGQAMVRLHDIYADEAGAFYDVEVARYWLEWAILRDEVAVTLIFSEDTGLSQDVLRELSDSIHARYERGYWYEMTPIILWMLYSCTLPEEVEKANYWEMEVQRNYKKIAYKILSLFGEDMGMSEEEIQETLYMLRNTSDTDTEFLDGMKKELCD